MSDVGDLVEQIDQTTRGLIRVFLGMHSEEDIYKVPSHVLEMFAKAAGMSRRRNGVTFSAADVILAIILSNEIEKLRDKRAAPAITRSPLKGDRLTDADWRDLRVESPLIVHYAGEQRDAKLVGKTGRKVRVAIMGDDTPFRDVDASKVIVLRQEHHHD